MKLSSKLLSSSRWRRLRLKIDKEELVGLKVMMAVVWSVLYSIVAEQEPLAGLKTNNKSKHQLSSHSRELVFRWAADKPLLANHSSIQRKNVH